MIITAHGGAMETGRNSRKYFDSVHTYAVDAIEVDVRKRGGKLYISHLPALFSKRAISLEYVFEYVKLYNLKVNCDLKNRGIIGDVIALAKKKGALDNLIFTGAVKPSDMPNATAGDIYINNCFYFPLTPTVENLPEIKAFIAKNNNGNIKGLNLSYRYVTQEFALKAAELNIPLSIYTVDIESELKRIMAYKPANITTNIIDKALKLRKELKI